MKITMLCSKKMKRTRILSRVLCLYSYIVLGDDNDLVADCNFPMGQDGTAGTINVLSQR